MKIRTNIAVATLLGALAASLPCLAQGSPEGPPEAIALPLGADSKTGVEAAPAELAADVGARGAGARSWLARAPSEPAVPAAHESSGASTGLTLGAVVLLLGLAGAAIYMRFKRQTALPLTPSESRLTVLSSSRVGPKAYAVTAHVGGRVLLLGVTEHNVTNLGWLDTDEPEAPAAERHAAGDAEESEDLPDDYPGSALRASKAPPVAFATTHELKRFQEVLRGAVSSRTELPMRPSYPARPAPDAASTLAAQTLDVMAAAPASIPSSASLRRKRRGGRDSVAPREPRAAGPSRAPKPVDPSFEGQVAGLRALRNGG